MTASRTLPGLDHLRALAIALVFVFHYGLFPHPTWIEDIGAFGWIGVDLFFVLSGYLIADQLFRAQQRSGTIALRSFYLRRAFRILPAYFTMVALYFLFPLIREREGIAPLWKYITFTQNIGLDLNTQGTFSHAWSLCVEEHFYLLLPLVMLTATRLHFRHAGALLAILLITGPVARAWAWWHGIPVELRGQASTDWYTWVYYPTPCRLDGLLVGISIAAVARYRPSWWQRLRMSGTALLACGCALLALAWGLSQDRYGLGGSVIIFTVVAGAFGCGLLAMLRPGFVPGLRATWMSRQLSELAFCLYLTHKAAIHCTQTWLASDALPMNGAAMFGCCLITSVLSALALRWMVEKPFLRLRDRWTVT
ncbi:MAG TPA: acyltransferase [Flavobacteriales bacterium]|nr:acyltransferase [Flavobacteriales bacterium]